MRRGYNSPLFIESVLNQRKTLFRDKTMILLILGYILLFIGGVTVDYKICEYFQIEWAFWIQIIGGIFYLIGAFISDSK